MKNLVEVKIDKNIKINPDLDKHLAPNNIYLKKDDIHKIGEQIYLDEILNEQICSISGTVVGTTNKIIDNKITECFIIENNFYEERKNVPRINKKYDKYTKIDLLNEIKNTEISYLIAELSKESNTLIIDAFDEGIYEYNKVFRIKEDINEYMDSINDLANILGCSSIKILFKESSEIGINNFINLIGLYSNINLVLLPDKYLINKTQISDNDINLNSEDIYKINEIVKKKKGISDKIISIYNDIDKTVILKQVKLYSLVSDVVTDNNNIDVYLNGYITGHKIINLENYVITENINSILILKKDKRKEFKCINCGACNRVCPKSINVKKYLDNNTQNSKCINCGLCNYICPANIDIRKVLNGDTYE